MKQTAKIISCLTVLLLLNSIASGVLKNGDKLLPFSLIGVDEMTVTVRLEEGKLTVIKEFEINGKIQKEKSHPDVILLDFWATWCVPCRAAMPHMLKLHEKYQPQQGQDVGGLELFGIALDTKGSKIVKPFLNKIKITYPMLADRTEGSKEDGIIHTTQEMKSRYKVQGIPVVYLIDSQGTIKHAHVGFKEKYVEELDHSINELIPGQ
jgi:thiol-disulfide isomerase/thioredoxin